MADLFISAIKLLNAFSIIFALGGLFFVLCNIEFWYCTNKTPWAASENLSSRAIIPNLCWLLSPFEILLLVYSPLIGIPMYCACLLAERIITGTFIWEKSIGGKFLLCVIFCYVASRTLLFLCLQE